MTSPLLSDPRLIVGLDLPSIEAARALVERIGTGVESYKVGLTLLARPGGVAFAHELRAMGKTVVAIKDLPEMPEGMPGPECLELSPTDIDPCAHPQLDDSNDFLDQAATRSSTPLVDLTRYVCAQSVCHAMIGGVSVYFDDNHLSYTFAQTLSPFLGRALERAIEP